MLSAPSLPHPLPPSATICQPVWMCECWLQYLLTRALQSNTDLTQKNSATCQTFTHVHKVTHTRIYMWKQNPSAFSVSVDVWQDSPSSPEPPWSSPVPLWCSLPSVWQPVPPVHTQTHTHFTLMYRNQMKLTDTIQTPLLTHLTPPTRIHRLFFVKCFCVCFASNKLNKTEQKFGLKFFHRQ